MMKGNILLTIKKKIGAKVFDDALPLLSPNKNYEANSSR